MTFISLPLAGVNLDASSVLFALTEVPENTLSLHCSISHLCDKRLGRAATCASLCLGTQRTVRCMAGGRQESELVLTGCRMMEGKGGKTQRKTTEYNKTYTDLEVNLGGEGVTDKKSIYYHFQGSCLTG